MKKIFLTLGVVLVALASCTKENVTNDILVNGVVKATFEQDAATRLNVAADNALTWSTGDAFAMFGEGSSAKFTLESGAGTASATFTGTVPAVVKGAAFPYISEYDPSLANGVLKMTLPATLEQSTEGKCNLPMWASASSVESISFKHLAGVLRVKVTDMPEGYNQLVVAASAPISGVFTANVAEEKPVLVSDSTEDSSKSVVVTFSEATAEANDYQLYLPLPVATYETLTVSISNGTETKELVKYNNKSVERAKIYTASLTYSSVTGNIVTEVETEEALVEALTAGKSVVLTDNVQVSEPLSVDSSVVVDLNGKTLTFDAATRAASNYGIENTGKLTISNGVIDDKVNNTTIRNSGQLVLNNVELTTTYVAVSNIGVWENGMTVQKYNEADAAVKFTMNGGSITSTTEVTNPNVYAVQSVDYSLTEIKDASIIGTHSAGGIHLNCAAANLDNVTITRGTAGTAHQVHLVAGILNYTDTEIDNYRYYYGDSKGKYGYAEVNGVYYGAVNQVVAVDQPSLETALAAAVDGTVVTLLNDITASKQLSFNNANKSLTIDLNGNTLNLTATYGLVNKAGKLVIKNGKISGNCSYTTLCNWSGENAIETVLENVDVIASYIAVYNRGVWADGMTVQKYNEEADAAVKFTMNGGSITSTTDVSTNVYAVHSVDYSLTDINGATIKGTKSAGGIHLNCAAANLDNVTITRGTAGTAHQVHLIAGILNYTDTDINNYRYYYGDKKGLYGYAEVNGVYYGEVNTVVTAVNTENALVEALAAGKSVVLTDDITASEQLSFNNANKSLTIDLNGKTLNLTATYGLVNKAGKLVIKNGKISGNCSYTTLCNWSGENAIETVLEDVDVTASYIAVYNRGVWADGKTVQDYKGTDAAVKFTMNRGSITSTTDVSTNVYAVQSVDYSVTDIKGATIKGTHSAGGIHLNCAAANLDNVTITRGTAGTAHQVHLIAGILNYTNTDINNYRYYYGDKKGLYGYAEVNGVYYGEVNTVVENK